MTTDEIIAKLLQEVNQPADNTLLPDINELPYLIERDENGHDNLPQ